MAGGCWYGERMAERDPFGRLPDENPLAGLGALSDGSTGQASEPVVAASHADWSGAEPAAAKKAKPAAAASAAKASTPPRTGNAAMDQSIAEVIRQAEALGGGSLTNAMQSVRVVGRVVKLVVFLVVIGVIAGVAKPIIDAGKDVRDAVGDIPSSSEVADDIPSTGGGAGEDGGGEQAVPTGLSSNSLLRRANLGRALKRLRTSGLGRVQSMTIRPDRIDARLLTKGGSLRSVQVRYDEPAIGRSGTSGTGFSYLETVPFARIDTSAPQRLARSAAGRARLPASRVDYVTLNSSQGTVTWGAYLKGGKIYLANSRGRITRRIS